MVIASSVMHSRSSQLTGAQTPMLTKLITGAASVVSKPIALMYLPAFSAAVAAGSVRKAVTRFGKRPVITQRAASSPIAMRMPIGASSVFSNSTESWPKNTLWLTLTKDASVSTEVTSAAISANTNRKFPLSTAFW